MALASKLELKINVPETDIAQVKDGQRVEIVADAYPERTFAGSVRLIAPETVVENNVTSFQVRVKLVSGLSALRSGMNVNVAFIGKSIPHSLTVLSVLNVAPEKTENLRVNQGGKDAQVTVTGTNAEYPSVRNAPVARGRFISPADVQRNNRIALLGAETARTLFGNQEPIGKKIRIRNLGFQVIGVMAVKGASLGRNLDEAIFIPLTTMDNQLSGRRTSQRSPTLQTISVTVHNQVSASAAQFQVTNLLRLRHKIRGVDDFTVRNQQDLLQTANNIANILTIALAAIAGVSLLVGGIGIMNIMLVSVKERTQEIGLRKALGATRNDVLTQFTIEAVILSTVGGLFGILLGVGGTLLIAALSPLDAVINPTVIVLAVGVSGSIGLGFGVIPARSAARLDPIVALRSQ